MRRGTRIEVRGQDAMLRPAWEPAAIVSRRPMTQYKSGADYPGWYLIRWAVGGHSVVHESGFRVVDNRP